MSTTTALNNQTLQFIHGHPQGNSDSLVIRDIAGMLPATALQKSAESLLGIISYRGKKVPVIDLRMHFFMGVPSHNEQICILVAEMDNKKAPLLIGALVDSEADAYELIISSTH